MLHGQRNPAVRFPFLGEPIQVSVNVNAGHFVNLDAPATDILTHVSESVSFHLTKAEGKDRRHNSLHVCIVLDFGLDMPDGTWSLDVAVGRTYSSSPEGWLAAYPDAHLPLRVSDGHAQPPTPSCLRTSAGLRRLSLLGSDLASSHGVQA